VSSNLAKLRYHGTGGALFGLVFVNGLLTMLTLGIYSFWAKNKVREFHYSHTELDGDRFAYHGTGGELLRGYFKAMVVVFALFIAVTIVGVGIGIALGDNKELASTIVSILLYAGIAVLMIAAVNGARRYRLSRSSWRGIRFSFHGKLSEFLPFMVGGILLSILSLGFYTPYFENKRRAFFVTHARFGSEPFMYEADGRELFKEYLKALLLTIPTLGIYWVWYAAFKHRYFWNNTTMRGARFHSTVSGSDLLALSLTNILLVVFTLGIGATWAATRTHAFFCDNVTLMGTVDWASISQQAQPASTTGEGLADSFDVDVGI